MNDFTKEELQDLINCINEVYKSHSIHPRISLELKTKIQSMIDNYCEHDGEIGKDYPAEKCMKCGAYWE